MLELSYSSLATFRSCKAKYKFQKIDHLYPKFDSPEISVGKILHEAFDLFFKGARHDTCRAYIESQFTEKISQADYREEEDLLIAMNITLGMWENYPFNTVKFSEMQSEKEFSVVIPNVVGPDNDPVYLTGRCDGLIRDSSGNLWIREVKTSGMTMDQVKSRADVSYQAAGYIWALQKAMGEKIHGVFYDIIRKPLLRKSQSENAQQFAKRNYDYYKDPANHSKLFGRHYSYRSQYAMDQFESDLIEDVENVVRSIKAQKFGRNTDACFIFGRECYYKKICFIEDRDPEMLAAYYKTKDEEINEAINEAISKLRED